MSLALIRRALLEEQGESGGSLSYVRPHEFPRRRFFPRYRRTGERIPGGTWIEGDCPRPVKGRCECPPEATIRLTPRPIFAILEQTYVMDPDGLWRCRRPMRRALNRLARARSRDLSLPEIVQRVLRWADQAAWDELEHRPRDEGRCPCGGHGKRISEAQAIALAAA